MMGCLLAGPSAQRLPLEYPSEPRILVEKKLVSDLPFFHLDYFFLRKLGIFCYKENMRLRRSRLPTKVFR
jgi:hypothetical protein